MKKVSKSISWLALILSCLLVSSISWASSETGLISAFITSITGSTESAMSYVACCNKTTCNKWTKTCKKCNKYKACTYEDDVAVPAAPAGLTASATSSSSINLVWNAVTGAASYIIYGGTSSSALSQIGTSTTAAFAQNNLTSNTNYYYAVAAKNASGTSAKSATVNATTLNAAPAAPAGLAATATSNSSVNLTWNSVTDATGYIIFGGTTSTVSTQIGTSATTAFTHNDLKPNTKYYYAVAAKNTAATSVNSATVNATTLTATAILTHNTAALLNNCNDLLIEAYLPNGKLAGSFKASDISSVTSHSLAGNLKLKTGIYQILIKDRSNGNLIETKSITMIGK